jgi:hypothetical protein
MVDVTVVKSESGELIKMGPIEIRVLEDGRNTDNRIGSVVLKIGPKTKGVSLLSLSPLSLSPLPFSPSLPLSLFYLQLILLIGVFQAHPPLAPHARRNLPHHKRQSTLPH